MDAREVLSRPAAGPDAVLRYGEHPDQLIDVHWPAGAADVGATAPLVVLVHGGFWRQAYDRAHTRPMAAALAQLGLAVATVEYRRTGGAGGWPATFDDAAAGVAVAPHVVAALRPGAVDPDDTVVVGHSAGGHLAIWAAQRSPHGIRRVVALAPVADLYEAHRRRLDGDAVAALMGGSPEDVPDRYATGDAAGLLPGPVPVVVVHGQRDEQVPVDMSRRLVGASPDVELVELPGVEHFGLIDPLSPAWSSVVAALRPPSPQAAG